MNHRSPPRSYARSLRRDSRETPRLVSLSALVTTLLASGSAFATTYQVGPTRTYTTLDDVMSLLGADDVVEVDGDHTYTGGIVVDASGTSGHAITIRGIVTNGKRPLFNGGTNTIEAIGNHLVFENLEMTGGSSRCFYHHGNDITLRGSLVHDCPTHGILGADSDSGSMLLEYTEVHHCGGGTQHHQIYMATDETANPGSVFRMQHCYVHDANGGNNVKSRAERNEIYYNWIEGALYHELELIGPDGQDPDLAREDSDVVGNVLAKTTTNYVVRFGGDGTGETNGRYRFVSNTVTVLEGGSAVFRLFDGIESVEMHDNVIWSAGNASPKIYREVEANWKTGSTTIAGSNNWIVNGSIDIPAAWTGTLTGADPGFASETSHDLHPTSSSPLRDAGNSSTSGPAGHVFPVPLALPLFHPPQRTLEATGTAQTRPTDGAIDIGAYEYGTGTPGVGGAAGMAGSAGSAGESGSAGTAGNAGNAGDAGSGGDAGTGGGGNAGNGGAGASAGTSGDGGSSGNSGAGGASGSAGESGAAGSETTGGTSGSVSGTSGESGAAGTTPAGSSGHAGASGNGGASGSSGTGGSSANAGAAASPAPASDDGGCSVATPTRSSPGGIGILAWVGLGWLLSRRRASRRA